MSQEATDVVTTQPRWTNKTINDVIKENEQDENPVSNPEDIEKEEKKRRRRNDCNDGFCCYVADDDNMFLNFLLCRWLGNCLTSCCRDQEGCCACDGGNHNLDDGNGDCCDCGDGDCCDCDCGDCDCGDCDCGDCSCFN